MSGRSVGLPALCDGEDGRAERNNYLEESRIAGSGARQFRVSSDGTSASDLPIFGCRQRAFAFQLRNGSCLREPGRFGAGQGDGSGRRDDRVTSAQGEALPWEKDLIYCGAGELAARLQPDSCVLCHLVRRFAVAIVAPSFVDI